jgi:uncharacterized membrane protein (UPF0127 family)
VNLASWAERAAPHERRVRVAAWVVLAAGLLGFVVRGADRPLDPALASEIRRPLPGLPELAFRVTAASGTTFDWCALLAATEAAREQGLMDQVDLGGYDGMVFRFEAPIEGQFFMYRTPLPLSIAFFDADGAYVAERDMAPCPAEDASDCPTYAAGAPYLHALEVPRGTLGHLGIGPGARLSFPGGPCP